MPSGDEDEIATGVFRFVTRVAMRALLEWPTFNPLLIRQALAACLELGAYANLVANARLRSNRHSRRRLGAEAFRSFPLRRPIQML